MGKEKLTDPLLFGRSTLVSSSILDILVIRGPDLVCAGVLMVGCRLNPLPVPGFTGGDETRVGAGWTLDGLLTRFGDARSIKFCGIVGTGGASGALGRAAPLAGDGSRKVLSDIELELRRRSNWEDARAGTELALEEPEFSLRNVRFVWTSATLVGVVGLDRRAAAAAAAESVALDLLRARNAWAAAVVAEGSTLALISARCKQNSGQYKGCATGLNLHGGMSRRERCKQPRKRTGLDAALFLRPNILATMGERPRKPLPTKG